MVGTTRKRNLSQLKSDDITTNGYGTFEPPFKKQHKIFHIKSSPKELDEMENKLKSRHFEEFKAGISVLETTVNNYQLGRRKLMEMVEKRRTNTETIQRLQTENNSLKKEIQKRRICLNNTYPKMVKCLNDLKTAKLEFDYSNWGMKECIEYIIHFLQHKYSENNFVKEFAILINWIKKSNINGKKFVKLNKNALENYLNIQNKQFIQVFLQDIKYLRFGNGNKNIKCCPICLDESVELDQVILNCCHITCKTCIDHWLAENKKYCPACGQKFSKVKTLYW